MEKDFTQFGGWLKFFYILFWINIVVSCLAVPTEIYLRLSGDPELAKYTSTVGFVESVLIGISYWFITRHIKVQSPEAKTLIHRIATFVVVAIFLLSLLGALLSGGPLWEAYDYPNHVFVPLTFVLYLAQSKRVKAYYHVPDEEQAAIKITREESTAVAQGLVRMFSIGMAIVIGIMTLTFVVIHVAQ